MTMTPSSPKNALIYRRLYRALLRAVKPFTPPSPNAAALSCLLHRSFVPVLVDEKLAQRHRSEEYAASSSAGQTQATSTYMEYYPELESDEEDNDPSIPQRYDPHFLLFRRLLWTLFAEGDQYLNNNENKRGSQQQQSIPMAPCYHHPQHVYRQPTKLRDMIRREFRAPLLVDQEEETVNGSNKVHSKQSLKNEFFSAAFPLQTRRDTAFLALRKLNEKLAWADLLQQQQQRQQTKHKDSGAELTSSYSSKQAAKHVEQIVWQNKPDDISCLLTPGTYLVSHPHMAGYFRRTVIAILQNGSMATASDDPNDNNKEDNEEEEVPKDESARGVYGVIVNRVTVKESTGNSMTLADALPLLPRTITSSVGGAPMKDGGPVHMPSIQMVHITDGTTTITTNTTEKDSDGDDNKSEGETVNVDDIGGIQLPNVVTGLAEKKIVSFKGDIMKAADAVATGQLDRDDVTFFVGASCWYPGQLEKEIQQGCWFLCRGPPDIVVSGACEHDELTEEGEPRPKADLWLSMLCACGEDEAKLAHIMDAAGEDDTYGAACDEF